MTTPTLSRQFVVILFSAALLVACQRSDPHLGTPAPGGSSVHIASVSPSVAEVLQAGEEVKMKVEIEYTLGADSGTLALVVQAADNSAVAQNFEVVTKGSGRAILEAEFLVPNTKAIQIFTPLSAQGQSSTSTVESRAFKVVTK
ncbi:hypothetical protein KGA65_11570 [Ideonella sp. B7]|uniref:hypothetical protein n=1 Tax=Ideonella benzenivorans TaxID=2831643 RepID=UPI001CED7013|nr:hypothetical protein [Ideonella benzenivorans]MCA6217181.1 hypothetical protein [Ideonella benzenivorans]